MEGRGLSSVAFRKEGTVSQLKVRPMIGNLIPPYPMWVDNTRFDVTKEGEISPLWKKIEHDPTAIHDMITNMSKKQQIKLMPIDMFQANGNSIEISELYKPKTKTYCMFRTVGNVWKLVIVGSKTKDEMIATGYNNKKESFCPLVITRLKEGFRIINPI